MSSLLFLFLLLLKNLSSLEVDHADGVTGSSRFVLVTAKGDAKSAKTVVGFISNERRSKEEKALSAKLKAIIADGYSHNACLKGLELLACHEEVVRESWAQTLNRARLLSMVGKTAEAEDLANDALRRLPDFAEAVGKAYEVLSFIKEFREPRQGGPLYRQWLEKRKGYVMKGLAAFPRGHFLLMNGFEVAVLVNNPAEALTYLNRAAWVDGEGTRQNLSRNPMTRKAMSLSPELLEAIRGLTVADDRPRLFKLAGPQLLILLVASALSLGVAVGVSKGLPRVTAPAPAAAELLLKAADAARGVVAAGTGFEQLKAGSTGFEQATPDLFRAGTGFEK